MSPHQLRRPTQEVLESKIEKKKESKKKGIEESKQRRIKKKKKETQNTEFGE
jgi:transposase